MLDVTAEFAPVSLTRIVANDSVRMVEWWAANNCPTPIDGDELARTPEHRAYFPMDSDSSWLGVNR